MNPVQHCIDIDDDIMPLHQPEEEQLILQYAQENQEDQPQLCISIVDYTEGEIEKSASLNSAGSFSGDYKIDQLNQFAQSGKSGKSSSLLQSLVHQSIDINDIIMPSYQPEEEQQILQSCQEEQDQLQAYLSMPIVDCTEEECEKSSPYNSACSVAGDSIFAPLNQLTQSERQSLSLLQSVVPQACEKSHISVSKPQICNVVASANMTCDIDLEHVVHNAINVEYNPRKFSGVVMRIRDPKTTCLIFSNGKLVCTGAKSKSNAKLALRKYARIIQKLGFPARFRDFRVENLVGSCDVEFEIRIEALAIEHASCCSYEPELFPALVYRMQNPSIVMLIFISGKVIFTGATALNEIYEAYENVYPVLKGFKRHRI